MEDGIIPLDIKFLFVNKKGLISRLIHDFDAQVEEDMRIIEGNPREGTIRFSKIKEKLLLIEKLMEERQYQLHTLQEMHNFDRTQTKFFSSGLQDQKREEDSRKNLRSYKKKRN